MGEFINFLLIAIFIIYIVRSFARLLLPMLFQKVVNKAQQQQRNPGGNYQDYSRNSSTSSGKVKVDHIPNPKKGSIPDSEGEVIDFEEIK